VDDVETALPCQQKFQSSELSAQFFPRLGTGRACFFQCLEKARGGVSNGWKSAPHNFQLSTFGLQPSVFGLLQP
jgi:hypothetical protein